MEEYTTYCTREQTRKALELLAPIESEIEYQFLANQEHGYYSGGTFQGLVECMGENTAIFGNEPNRIACIIPTAEQMIGWLRVKGFKFILSDDVDCNEGNNWWIGINDELITQGCNENKELAAIDAALEYLENLKQ